jgi:hypothetical protein
MNKFVLIFLSIFLIVSITPVSAELYHESFSDDNIECDKAEDAALNSITAEMSEIQEYTSSLNDSVDYIKNRAGDYNWKIWKWPGITSDILDTLKTMLTTVDLMEGQANKIHEDTTLLNNQIQKENLVTSTSNNEAQTIDYNDITRITNTNYMVNELSKRLKINVTYKSVNPGDVKNGDVVQYMSDGKYLRYLNVVDLKTNESVKQDKNNLIQGVSSSIKQSRGDVMDYTAFIEGSGNRIVPWILPQTVTDIVIENNTGIDTQTVVRTATEIQQEQINKTRERGNHKKATANKLLTAIKVIGGTGASLIGIGVIAIGVGSILFFTGVGTGPGAALVVCGAILSLWALKFFSPYVVMLGIAYHSINGQADDLIEEANQKQADLDKWTNNTNINKDYMDIDTFKDIPTIKHPPMGDWKQLHPILIKKPEHGTVLFGPGLQFLYGPDKGYVGTDVFVFVYVNEGATKCETMGQMTVHINIKALPLLPSVSEEA